MINRVMSSGAAAVALAASAFFVLPAAADPVAHSHATLKTNLGSSSHLVIQVGGGRGDYYRNDRRRGDYRRNGRYRLNHFGQDRREVRHLRRDALRSCRARIDRVASRRGFRDVDFDDDRYVNQYAPYGFTVRFDDVEFEGRRRDRVRSVTCVFDRGRVVRLDGVPRTRANRRGIRNDRYRRNDRRNISYRGYDQRGGYDGRYDGFTQAQWRTYDRRHQGHNHARGDYCAIDDGYRY